MEGSRVSIIVPAYNVENYIATCLDSLVGQAYENLEIIVVDDGSTDKTGEIADEYAARDGRVRVIHKENGGLSSSREAGISEASGEFITVVDADDWLEPEALLCCVEAMRADERVECVLFSYVKEYPSSSVPVHIFDKDMLFLGDDAEDRVYRRLFGLAGDELAHPEALAPVGSCCMKLYRASDARRGKYFHTDEVGSAEDALFNMYALDGVRGYAYLDKCFYHYRKSEGSITATYRPRLLEQWSRLYGIMESIIAEKRLGEKYSEALSNYIALNIVGFGINEFSNKNNGIFHHAGKIKEYLVAPRMREAIRRLDKKKLPFKWRVFMFFARHRMAFMLSLMFVAINVLKKKG